MKTRRMWFEIMTFVVVAASMLTAAFMAGFATRLRTAREVAGRYALVTEARDILDRQYLGEMPSETGFEYDMIRGMLNALHDPYTVFVEPQQAELDSNRLQGAFGGIGSVLNRNEAGEVVLSPYRDQPAARAGILDGDILIAVDGVRITPDTSMDDVVALIRGEVGTRVKLVVRTGAGPEREVRVKRAEIQIPSVTWRQLEQDLTIGLIDIDHFSDRTLGEVETALEELQGSGVSRLILDLRGNGGGLLDASIDVAGLFLDGGVILFEERRDRDEKAFMAPLNGLARDIPLVVLVDGGSASASEIVAGALHDRGRAQLIGQSTFGKGSVQLVFSLSDGSSLHVTNARWYTPNRTPLDGVGLTPDIVVDPNAENSDPFLERAVEYFNNAQ